MSDFSDPKYASYVQLCRELRLKRSLDEFRLYQNFEGWDQLEADGRIYSAGIAFEHHPMVTLEEADPIWLPTLADWLEMLEEVGQPWVLIESDQREGLYDAAAGSIEVGSHYDSPDHRESAPTREEAAARLWLAVTRTKTASMP